MATKNWNNDFMVKVLEEAAWKELSSEFAWNEQLLEKFKNKVDWEELSDSDNEHLFTAENLERYKDYWNWAKLSRNSDIELTSALLEQFAEYWDWNEIIDRQAAITGTTIMHRYRKNIWMYIAKLRTSSSSCTATAN